GNRQPPSRWRRTRSSDGGTVRRRRPTPSGAPSFPSTTVWIQESQPSRRTVSGASGAPHSSTAVPSPPETSAPASTWTTTNALPGSASLAPGATGRGLGALASGTVPKPGGPPASARTSPDPTPGSTPASVLGSQSVT